MESNVSPSKPSASLEEALGLMCAALDYLDEVGAPGDIGAYLDMAIQRVRKELGWPPTTEEAGEGQE